jgi:uncharacterized protein YciI
LPRSAGAGHPQERDRPREAGHEEAEVHIMKFVVIGEPSGVTMQQIRPVYPRHKALVVARGDVIGIGPFDNLGNMAIFRTRGAAEEFVRQDPFLLEGIVKSYAIREWNDALLA